MPELPPVIATTRLAVLLVSDAGDTAQCYVKSTPMVGQIVRLKPNSSAFMDKMQKRPSQSRDMGLLLYILFNANT
jgi:hypothetical protein